MHYRNGKYGFENIGTIADFLTKSNRKIGVSTTDSFELPNGDKIVLIPAVFEK